MQKTEPEWELTGVGYASSPAQTVQTNGGALREAVGFEGHPPEGLDGSQGDPRISLWKRNAKELVQINNIITDI